MLCVLLALLLPVQGLAVTAATLAVLWTVVTLHARRFRSG